MQKQINPEFKSRAQNCIAPKGAIQFFYFVINSSTAPEGDTSGLYIPDIGLHGTATDDIWWDIHYYPDTINKTNMPASEDFRIHSQIFTVPNLLYSKIQFIVRDRGTNSGTASIGDKIDIEWVKLELGSVPTPFIPPNPVEELLKIQSMNDDGTPKLVSNDILPAIMNSEMVSNPNLLDNPDFRINQSNFTSVITTDDTRLFVADRWYTANLSASLTEDGLTIAWNGVSSTYGWLQQRFPNSTNYIGKAMSISINVDGIIYSTSMTFPSSYSITSSILLSLEDHTTYTSIAIKYYSTTPITIKWIKAELGNTVTSFIPPNHVEELLKVRAMDTFGTLKHSFPET